MDSLCDMPKLAEGRLRRMFRQMLLGIGACHDARIVHRDVKLDNFLYGGLFQETIKLSDFGLAVKLGKRGYVKGVSGTAPYMSPEMLARKRYTTQTDVWSFASTVYVILYGDVPYCPSEPTAASVKKVAEYQVTDIPDGIRQHPYRRDRLPTLEVMLLWEDPSNGSVRGRCLFTMPHPEVPKLEDVDDIFAEIEPFFAKRWLKVQLALETPQQGDFAETPPDLGGLPLSGADVMVLACHPRGFASEASESVVHVSQCQPLSFKAKTDDAGQAQICFLPASLNKVQVTETAVFHGTEVSLMGSELKSLDEGVTNLTVRLLPKAQASLSVHVFCMPKKMPEATEEMFGIIDWAAEDRQAIPAAKVDVTPLETNGMQLSLQHTAEDSFEASLAEGCFSVKVACDGYETEERTLMLLVGPNHVYFPMVPRSVNVE